ncbi:putative neprosin activation peptide [Helianthus annuus]|nr:putative neprosin activation peptide [Helianthus annuus]
MCLRLRVYVTLTTIGFQVLMRMLRLRSFSLNKLRSNLLKYVIILKFSDQPAFDHPLLKNHTIKMRPIYHPNPVDDNKVSSMVNATADRHSSSSITQLWHSNGKCPKGTIPIRRTKKEDILRASSVDSYGKKKSFIGKSSFIDVELGVTDGHEVSLF